MNHTTSQPPPRLANAAQTDVAAPSKPAAIVAPLILGIESSCDETGVALVDSNRHIHLNLLRSSIAQHQAHGGVVPEIAARAQLQDMLPLLKQAISEKGFHLEQIAAFAATGGPGLIGGVMVGVMFAKALAVATGKPFIAINHLEAHALTARLSHNIAYPYLLLLVSGGHTQWLLVRGLGDYRLLGETLDDAAGEAFDKCAKLLGLPYPGGPHLEKLAATGNAGAAPILPRPLKGRSGCDVSFSGLKTRVRQIVQSTEFEAEQKLNASASANLAAAVQTAIADTLADRTQNALHMARALCPKVSQLVVSGGVAANGAVRAALQNLAEKNNMAWVAPPLHLCTDNAAMVAWAGVERFKAGLFNPLDFAPRPRWPLAELADNLAGHG